MAQLRRTLLLGLLFASGQTRGVQVEDIDHNALRLAPWPWTIWLSFGMKPSNPSAIPEVSTEQPRHRVRKMSTDEGEKFWPDFWGPAVALGGPYEVGLSQHPLGLSSEDRLQNQTEGVCQSGDRPFFAPFSAHESDFRAQWSRIEDGNSTHLLPRQVQSQCPSGSTSCQNIGRPARCCNDDTNCYILSDTSSGDVGCCPKGQTCNGAAGPCAYGFPTCNGGGCCIPGYTCGVSICVPGNTILTVFVQATSQSTSTTSSTTTIIVPPLSSSSRSTRTSYTTVVSVSTSTVVPSTTESSGSSSSSTSLTPSSSTSSDLPAPSTTSPTSLLPPIPPVLATSGDFSSTSTITTSLIPPACATGFYACQARYGGGCCRTGRNCAETDCPATSTVPVVTYNGLVIGVPSGPAATTTSISGTCAQGWALCSASLGGNCCPSGYRCGSVSCDPTTSAVGTAEVAKQVPSSAERASLRSVYLLLSTLACLCLLVL